MGTNVSTGNLVRSASGNKASKADSASGEKASKADSASGKKASKADSASGEKASKADSTRYPNEHSNPTSTGFDICFFFFFFFFISQINAF